MQTPESEAVDLCYRFDTPMNALSVITMLLAFAVPPMPGEHQPRSQQRASQSQGHANQPDLPPASVTNNQPTCYYEEHTSDKPQGWHKLIAWPEGITTWAIMLTLGAIVWQTWETRKAAKGAGESAAAAIIQTKTMKDRERARLSILSVFTPLLAYNTRTGIGEIPLKITMLIINDGNSWAFNIRAEGHFDIEEIIDSPEASVSDESLDWYRLDMPTTIRSVGKESQTEIFVTHMPDSKRDSYAIDVKTANALRSGELTIKIGGEITYEDAFGDKHKTPFFYLWDVNGDEGIGGWGMDSRWVNLSAETT